MKKTDPPHQDRETTRAALRDLRQLPGVGEKTALDLLALGFRSAGELKGRDPEKMYRKLCRLRGTKIDRCMLYVFRCAVYAAGTPKPQPELLKWWNWKDSDPTAKK
jgi:hypothetical protein